MFGKFSVLRKLILGGSRNIVSIQRRFNRRHNPLVYFEKLMLQTVSVTSKHHWVKINHTITKFTIGKSLLDLVNNLDRATIYLNGETKIFVNKTFAVLQGAMAQMLKIMVKIECASFMLNVKVWTWKWKRKSFENENYKKLRNKEIYLRWKWSSENYNPQ